MKRNGFNQTKAKSRSESKKEKVFQAEAEVVALNERDLPRRLGLLLRNSKGQEKWFSWWRGGRHGNFPSLSEGDLVRIAYCQKPPKKKGGEPFLNILELEVIDIDEDEDGAQEAIDEVEVSPNERVREILAEELRREVSIRAAVAVKAAAAWGWAKDMDGLLACAEEIYKWLKAKEEEELAEANLLGEEVSVEEG